MYKKVGVGLFLFLSLFITSPAYAIGSFCGPSPVLAPTEYCTFYSFIKAGEDDAIIMLSWDALGPGMQGVPTPSMVGEYYFYFKDGRLYYLGNTTGAYELFYVFHNGLWYLSDGRAIDPDKPCIIENVTIPAEIRDELCPCGNVSIKSPSYPANFTGSLLQVSDGSTSYTIEVPANLSIPLPENVTLQAVFLEAGVLVYTRPQNPFVPLDWKDVAVFYYDGKTLRKLNFTKALEEGLPACQSTPNGDSMESYVILLFGAVLVVVFIYLRNREG
ncbi:hypothetical protein SAMN05216170_0530 [Thermococcus thioreducens]|uniref:Uncharacterized protein n=3 Tax=Thermococcus thioreducens TaxID=277988 RepID=A0A1I0MH13_9EURY|nr:hypothetical protein SAMN05216170_0530 [Thermococcus thioreducens]